MIKTILKAILPAKQIEKLRVVRDRMYAALVRLWSAMCRVLPEDVVLFLRCNTKLVKKMDYEREDIFLNIASDVEYNIRIHSCAKEPETIEWIHTFFQEGDVYYDIGANVGAYALVASKRYRGNVRVYAFEPSFSTFKELCANVFLNNCQASIVPLQIALSDHTGVDVLNYSNLTPGGALHALGEAIDYKGDTFQPVLKQPVLTFALDDLIKHFSLPVPNHIKIDVDGIELKILKGAEVMLTRSAVKSLVVEIEEGDQEAEEIVQFLKGKGFNVHKKHPYTYGGADSPFSNVANYIFTKA